MVEAVSGMILISATMAELFDGEDHIGFCRIVEVFFHSVEFFADIGFEGIGGFEVFEPDGCVHAGASFMKCLSTGAVIRLNIDAACRFCKTGALKNYRAVCRGRH
jgi:hypothetical protein